MELKRVTKASHCAWTNHMVCGQGWESSWPKKLGKRHSWETTKLQQRELHSTEQEHPTRAGTAHTCWGSELLSHCGGCGEGQVSCGGKRVQGGRSPRLLSVWLWLSSACTQCTHAAEGRAHTSLPAPRGPEAVALPKQGTRSVLGLCCRHHFPVRGQDSMGNR